MNQYETVIILTPVLSEQQMKDAVAGYRELITTNGGELVHEENWGLNKLAYPIQKKGTGFYHVFEYKANPEFIELLKLNFQRDENIMRELTLKLDKHAMDFNEKKRNGHFDRKREERQAAAAAAEAAAEAPVVEAPETEVEPTGEEA